MGESQKTMINRIKAFIGGKINIIINSWIFAFILGFTIAYTGFFCYINGKTLYQELFAIKTVYIASAYSATCIEQADATAQPEALPLKDGRGVEVSIQKIAEKYDIDWKMVYAICKVESNCNSDRIGDNGGSYGAFQISLPHHPNITKEQAQNMEWSAEWTIKHGLKYKDDRALFFKNHNGIGKTNNQWYIDRCENIYKTL